MAGFSGRAGMSRNRSQGSLSAFIYEDHIIERIPIQKINTPGCYVDSRHGSLYRVSPEMISIGGSVFYGFVSKEPWYVTKISDDYTIPLDEARIIAANASLRINF
jgi:hypothetical protein